MWPWKYSLGSQGKLPIVRANPLIIPTAKDGVGHGSEHLDGDSESHLDEKKEETREHVTGWDVDGGQNPSVLRHWTLGTSGLSPYTTPANGLSFLQQNTAPSELQLLGGVTGCLVWLDDQSAHDW